MSKAMEVSNLLDNEQSVFRSIDGRTLESLCAARNAETVYLGNGEIKYTFDDESVIVEQPGVSWRIE